MTLCLDIYWLDLLNFLVDWHWIFNSVTMFEKNDKKAKKGDAKKSPSSTKQKSSTKISDSSIYGEVTHSNGAVGKDRKQRPASIATVPVSNNGLVSTATSRRSCCCERGGQEKVAGKASKQSSSSGSSHTLPIQQQQHHHQQQQHHHHSKKDMMTSPANGKSHHGSVMTSSAGGMHTTTSNGQTIYNGGGGIYGSVSPRNVNGNNKSTASLRSRSADTRVRHSADIQEYRESAGGKGSGSSKKGGFGSWFRSSKSKKDGEYKNIFNFVVYFWRMIT